MVDILYYLCRYLCALDFDEHEVNCPFTLPLFLYGIINYYHSFLKEFTRTKYAEIDKKIKNLKVNRKED